MFKCSASYIKESFENWDLKFVKKEVKKEVKEEFINDENVDVIDKSYLEKKISIVLNKLSNKRSENADDWFRVVWCIINICKKEQLNRRICYKLIHLFSKKAVNYDEYRVDEFVDKNIDNNKEEGLSWNYLYQTCLKEDDIDYYTSINTKNYYVLKKEFEKNGRKFYIRL